MRVMLADRPALLKRQARLLGCAISLLLMCSFSAAALADGLRSCKAICTVASPPAKAGLRCYIPMTVTPRPSATKACSCEKSETQDKSEGTYTTVPSGCAERGPDDPRTGNWRFRAVVPESSAMRKLEIGTETTPAEELKSDSQR
jgi:hypothetical protein